MSGDGVIGNNLLCFLYIPPCSSLLILQFVLLKNLPFLASADNYRCSLFKLKRYL